MKKTVLERLLSLEYDEKLARSLIMAGKVFKGSEKILNASEKISDNEEITVKDSKEWVSRGAYKLQAAIKEFNLNFQNHVVLDIGSSTGGFTQVALKNGATKVYALDSGTNQLDYSLRTNTKVVAMEKTNLKNIEAKMFNPLPEIAVCDVSFISLKHVFKVLKENLNSIPLMALIKPQFEANSDQVLEGGFVPEELHEAIIAKVKGFAQEQGYKLIMIKKSPIEGGVAKNIEYISLWEEA